MRRAGLVDAAGDLSRHDHVCWVFDAHEEFRSAAERFLADGLADGLRVLFSADWADVDDLDAINGFAAARAAGSAHVGDLGGYGAGAIIDPDAQVAAYAAATEL